MADAIYVGVDLGGTRIKVGICDRQGVLMHTYEGDTDREHGAEAVIANIANYVDHIVAQNNYRTEQIAGIGVGIPAFLDIKSGVVLLAPNLKWENVPIKAKLEDRLGMSVRINNDANVAALGEAWSGAGKGIANLVCYTLGTGVGGGIIVDGKLVEGFSGMAGEIGHIQVVPDLEAVQCGCGQMGCMETVSSATGIVRMAEYAVERGDRTSLSALDQVTAKDVFDAARSGDETAERIIHRAAYYIGKSMGVVAVVLNPQRFIVGGGVSKAGDILLQPIKEHFAKYTPKTLQKNIEIVPAELGNDAGVVGAAGLHLR